eukprot:1442011-Lingulodinium_polyedra.AAC.1
MAGDSFGFAAWLNRYSQAFPNPAEGALAREVSSALYHQGLTVGTYEPGGYCARDYNMEAILRKLPAPEGHTLRGLRWTEAT